VPLVIRCDELQPGMDLFEDILWRDRVMLPAGKVLTDTDIAALHRRFPDLTIRVKDPVLDEIIEFENDTHDREVAETVKQKIAGAVSTVSEQISSRASMARVDFRAVRAAVKQVMHYLSGNPVSAALLARTVGGEGYLAEHTGSTFYLSLVLGAAARPYIAGERQRQSKARDLQTSVAMDLAPLGVGAAFMDLGMISLEHLYQAKRQPTAEEWQRIWNHPVDGSDMLPDDISPVAKTVVRYHHENMDGTGYPSGLTGDKIHVLARVIRIADAYASATADRVYREARSSVRALWEMSVGPYRRFYDPELMKVFTRLIQPFPIGARLVLEDGRTAVVVRYNHASPFEPIATIAFDIHGELIPESELGDAAPLEGEKGFRIKSYDGEDLSYLYDDAANVTPEAPARGTTTIFEAAYP